jgi:hypothetical protein
MVCKQNAAEPEEPPTPANVMEISEEDKEALLEHLKVMVNEFESLEGTPHEKCTMIDTNEDRNIDHDEYVAWASSNFGAVDEGVNTEDVQSAVWTNFLSEDGIFSIDDCTTLLEKAKDKSDKIVADTDDDATDENERPPADGTDDQNCGSLFKEQMICGGDALGKTYTGQPDVKACGQLAAADGYSIIMFSENYKLCMACKHPSEATRNEDWNLYSIRECSGEN